MTTQTIVTVDTHCLFAVNYAEGENICCNAVPEIIGDMVKEGKLNGKTFLDAPLQVTSERGFFWGGSNN